MNITRCFTSHLVFQDTYSTRCLTPHLVFQDTYSIDNLSGKVNDLEKKNNILSEEVSRIHAELSKSQSTSFCLSYA